MENKAKKINTGTISAGDVWELAKQVKQLHPLVHCITNAVTVNDCANIVLALGASPTMAHHPQEVEEITAGAASLVCNLGATDDLPSMLLSGKTAHEMGKPIILDPVGVSGSTYRREWCLDFIKKVRPTCIRGNYSEIRALMENRSTIIGVDAAQNSEGETASFSDEMMRVAKEQDTILVASGRVDWITDGISCYQVENGQETMAKITGSGCMSSVLMGAFFSAEQSIKAAVATCVWMGISGELAYDKTRKEQGGTMTFRMKLIDAISLMDEKDIQEKMKLCMVEEG